MAGTSFIDVEGVNMHLSKHEAILYNKRKLNKLHKEAKRYPQPVYEKNGRLVRCYKGSHRNNRYQYYKRVSNRQVRRYDNYISNGGTFKKISDYWYNVD